MHEPNPGPRKSLRDILRGKHDAVAKVFDNTEAAAEMTPIPSGIYEAEVLSGEPFEAGTGSPGFKITFCIVGGDYQGRRLWLNLWLTVNAMKLTRRDLQKLGVSNFKQLEKPLPKGIICKVRTALKTDDKGIQRNEVREFEVIRVVQPEPEPFAVEAEDSEHGDAWEPPTPNDEESFPPNRPGESEQSTEGR